LRASLVILMCVGLLSSAGLSAAVIDLVVYRLRHDLGESGRAVGTCLGVAAIGALGGALFAPRLQGRVGFGACLLAGPRCRRSACSSRGRSPTRSPSAPAPRCGPPVSRCGRWRSSRCARRSRPTTSSVA